MRGTEYITFPNTVEFLAYLVYKLILIGWVISVVFRGDFPFARFLNLDSKVPRAPIKTASGNEA